MSKTEQNNTQPLGLDIGTSRIVLARSNDRKYEYQTQLNAFVVLPNSKLVATLLTQENVFHEVHGQEIVVAGNDAEKFAEVLHVETRRPMLDGVLNPNEPHSLAVMRRIITKVAGRAASEGQKLYYSIPASSGNATGIAYHSASCRQILTELGYDATPIEEGLAVVIGELGSSNYTGIGISCGSGMCNVCLAVLSIPVVSFSVPKAGDFIDSQTALVTGERATRVRVQKETDFHLNGFTADRVQNAFTIHYQEMVHNLVDAMCANISSNKRLPKLDQPIPLVLSGGTAMPKGFLELFEKTLSASDFPVRLSGIQVSSDPLLSTARGAMMAALCS